MGRSCLSWGSIKIRVLSPLFSSHSVLVSISHRMSRDGLPLLLCVVLQVMYVCYDSSSLLSMELLSHSASNISPTLCELSSHFGFPDGYIGCASREF